ncbi:hypothetical protein MNBD_GAMMA10-658 [hydrothermal vent metagenome]|uniref:Uncharacterized protein n=1 Tax=hydrothermal vent metagenome TaxID=652676 RepID=A0A3B0Y3H4_9ZZZZ
MVYCDDGNIPDMEIIASECSFRKKIFPIWKIYLTRRLKSTPTAEETLLTYDDILIF